MRNNYTTFLPQEKSLIQDLQGSAATDRKKIARAHSYRGATIGVSNPCSRLLSLLLTTPAVVSTV